jgi:hypothetical protein
MKECARTSPSARIFGAAGDGAPHATRPGRLGIWIAVAALAALCGGCMSVGRDFPVAPVDSIEIGTTTMTDVRSLFGEPWRQGVEDGERTWTYAKYHYSAFSETRTRDLKVRFDAQGRVVSFSFNSTYPEDARH